MKRRFNLFCRVVAVPVICWFFVTAAISAQSNSPGDGPLKAGRLLTQDGDFAFRVFPHGVEICDRDRKIVFQARDEGARTLALSCGHSESHGFFAFFQRVDPVTGLRHLRMVSSLRPPETAVAAEGNFYSPVLVTDPGDVVVAVTEGFRLAAWDLESGRKLWERVFQAPVINPRRILVDQREALQFQLFFQGRYRSFHFFTGPGFPPGKIYGPDTPDPPPRSRSKEPGPDPTTILAFGDSITYGYVDKAPAPDLGYVPRLQSLLDGEFQGVFVFNAGNPAETTVKAMNRYDQVLSYSQAAFLLFHEGINDTIHPGDIPVSTTLFNIRVIMQRALELGMNPVLSTIIPRSPAHWSGVGIFRQRAEAIREGILVIAADLSLALIDFWQLFTQYPANDGGYAVLMSDYVHPSEKGYQLMAENWHQTLLAIPPAAPQDIAVASASPWQIVVSWRANREFDIQEYLVRHGASPLSLTQEILVSLPQVNLLRPPFRADLQRERWIQVFARDRDGNTGPGSAVTKVEFSSLARPEEQP